MKRVLFLFSLMVVLTSPAVAFNYSTDFENYSLGTLEGQDGWVITSYGSLPEVIPFPEVIADPTTGSHGNVLSMHFAGDNNWIGAWRPVEDLIASGYTQFSLSWDQYRPAFDGSISFAQDDIFEGWWGFQDAGTLYVNYFDSPTIDLTASEWQNIRFDFKVTDVTDDGVYGTAEGFLNNTSFGVAQSVVLDKFQGFNFQISENYGAHTSPIYLDNISLAVVPEPSSLAVMLTGLCGAGWSLRRRRN